MAVSKLTPAHIAVRIAARRDKSLAATLASQALHAATPPTPAAVHADQRSELPPIPETMAASDRAHAPVSQSATVRRAAPRPGAGEDARVIDEGILSVLNVGAWRRECFILPPEKAREAAAAWLDRYPRARWRSEIENWRVVGDDLVQVILRRLPDAKSPG